MDQSGDPAECLLDLPVVPRKPVCRYSPRITLSLLFLAASFSLASGVAVPVAIGGEPVIRLTPIEGRPYSGSAAGAAGASVFLSSGLIADFDVPADVKSQALHLFSRFSSTLRHAGQSLSDVGFVRAYLAPGSDGQVDYEGWDAAWAETFKGTLRPARSTVAVPSLGSPKTLIELEFATFDSAEMGHPTPDLRQLPADRAQYYSSGTPAPVPHVTAAAKGTVENGDTVTQARNALRRLMENLALAGLASKDVAHVRAFIAPDPQRGGLYDFDGWKQAFIEAFPGPTPPALVMVATPNFGDPARLIEVEVIATFPTVLAAGQTASSPPQRPAEGAAAAPCGSAVIKPANSPLFFSAGVVSGGQDVEAQATAALDILESRMREQGLGLDDIVLLRAYIVPDAQGVLDLDGWSAAWSRHFTKACSAGSPAQTIIAVHSLPRPELKIEIDVVAAKQP